jgi:uncharacterized membrane protein YgcG
MSGLGRRFDPSETHLDGGDSPSTADLAQAMVAARELEAFAARDSVGPTVGFEDRVMEAIAAEPVPRLLVRPGGAVRGGLPLAFLASFRDAWRLATGSGRPVAVRAQAFAFVLLVVLATGSLTTVFAVGAASFLSSGPSPSPSVSTPSASPAPLASPSPSPLPSPSTSPSPTSSDPLAPDGSASPGMTAEPTDMLAPGDTAGPTDDHGSGGAAPTKTPKPTRTPRATETPEPDETAEPTETDDDGGDDHGGGGGDDGGGDDGGGGSGGSGGD